MENFSDCAECPDRDDCPLKDVNVIAADEMLEWAFEKYGADHFQYMVFETQEAREGFLQVKYPELNHDLILKIAALLIKKISIEAIVQAIFKQPGVMSVN